MPKALLLNRTISAFAIGLLASCSVYVPLQPGVPMVHKKGEAEVLGSAYLSGRLEGSVAYSPVKHLLVRAAGGLRSDKGDSTYFRIRQYEVGAGTYRYLAEKWLVGGMLGYGNGRSSRRYLDNFENIWRDSLPANDYTARFYKLFTEAYLAHDAGWTTFGTACRLSQVRFSTLTNRGVPVPIRRMTRVEPMAFVRFNGRRWNAPWLQAQLATSLSWSPDYERNPSDFRVRDIKESRLFTSIGVAIYPHLFKE